MPTDQLSTRRLPKERPVDGEYFAPIELDPKVAGQLERVRYDGPSPLKDRLHRIRDWDKWSMEQRIAFLRSFVEDTARDPAIVAKANEIIRAAGVKHRDYQGEWAALLKWVQQNIRFTAEPKERIQSPQYTLSTKGGDCLPAETPLLEEGFLLTAIQDIKVGSKIWGYDKWSRVEAVVDKGELEVDSIALNNGTTFRATPGHKVFVLSCEKHGTECPEFRASSRVRNCTMSGKFFSWVRIEVRNLREGMVLASPDRISFGTQEVDPRRAYVEGLYLSDGWAEPNAHRFSISGKDGFPKEAQKREVAEICQALGIDTRWHSRYIAVNDAKWTQHVSLMGKYAPDKHALTLNLGEEAAAELLRGIMADSGENTNGKGRTFSSTSPLLALQVRILQKMFGRTCSWRYLEDHGGLGTHPIYRVGVRVRTEWKGSKKLRVKRIDRSVAVTRCYDIQTDDHYVYLPEADVTVSNCDDLALALAGLGYSLRLPFKFVLSGRKRSGERIRWVEGEGRAPRGVNWSHIYVQAQWPPFRPTSFAFAEPTLDVPLGFDATRDPIPANRADLGIAAPEESGLLPAVRKLTKELPWVTITGSVVGSIISAVVVGMVIRPALEKRKRLRKS